MTNVWNGRSCQSIQHYHYIPVFQSRVTFILTCISFYTNISFTTTICLYISIITDQPTLWTVAGRYGMYWSGEITGPAGILCTTKFFQLVVFVWNKFLPVYQSMVIHISSSINKWSYIYHRLSINGHTYIIVYQSMVIHTSSLSLFLGFWLSWGAPSLSPLPSERNLQR